MRLVCPFCGERGIEEFSYGGAAGPARPDANAPFADWVAHVYLRDNPAGPHEELWYHAAACRQVLTVTRDTRTHAIIAVKT